MTPLNGLCPPSDEVIKLDYTEFMTNSEEHYFDSYDQAVKSQAPLMESKELPQALNVKVVESALDTQVSGSHYDMPIQPIEFIFKNKLPYMEANILKYIVRHSKKNGIEDLEKAKHYIDMLIEMEYGESK